MLRLLQKNTMTNRIKWVTKHPDSKKPIPTLLHQDLAMI